MIAYSGNRNGKGSPDIRSRHCIPENQDSQVLSGDEELARLSRQAASIAFRIPRSVGIATTTDLCLPGNGSRRE